MKKRGASEAIIFVLLVGFSIAMAIMVIKWYTTTTKDFTEFGIELVEKSSNCDKTFVNVRDISQEKNCSHLSIINKGYLEVNKVITRSTEDNKSEVIPVITSKETGKEIGCKEKTISLNCNFPQGISPDDISLIFHNIDLAPNKETSQTTEGNPINVISV